MKNAPLNTRLHKPPYRSHRAALLVLFSTLALFVVQLTNALHDIEHAYHDHTPYCDTLLAADTTHAADSPLKLVLTLDLTPLPYPIYLMDQPSTHGWHRYQTRAPPLFS